MLYGGVIVDQKNRRLIMPNALFMDGPTGNIYNAQGQIVKRFQEEKLFPTRTAAYYPHLNYQA
jgi:hypothetical protein